MVIIRADAADPVHHLAAAFGALAVLLGLDDSVPARCFASSVRVGGRTRINRGAIANIIGCIDGVHAVGLTVVLFGGIRFGRLDACAGAASVDVIIGFIPVVAIIASADDTLRYRWKPKRHLGYYRVSLVTYSRPIW